MSKTTLQTSKTLKRTHYAVYFGKFLVPVIPALIVTGVNWDEWFNKQGVSLPFGIATMLIAILIAIYSYSKSENQANGNKISPFFFIGAILSIFACSFLLLANILSQMGLMFIYVIAGIFGAGALDQVDKSIITSRMKEYNELVDKYDLDERKLKKKQAKEERRKKAELEAQRKQELLRKEQESATE